MDDLLRLILHFAFGCVAFYVGGCILLVMLPYILDMWYIWATLIGLGLFFYLFKFIQFYREEMQEQKKIKQEKK